ncbi:abortive phage infection protein [Crenothrix sp. D3]|nr:abortive phage infection protein [Crenothrix sp. D3]
MIVDFTVSNFRSIKDEQTFSLYVQIAGSHLPENISYPASDKIGVLKSAGLYGANASGKSNLLLAFNALQYIVVRSGDLKEGESIIHEPYLLAEDSKLLPTRFEVEFFVPSEENVQTKAVRYRYCVAFTAREIVEESLVFYPSGQEAKIFNRGVEDTWQTIPFGSLYKGGKKRLPFFANNAYLSKAGDSADTPKMIRDVYNYFRKNLLHLGVNQRVSKLNWLEDIELVKKVAKLLTLVDTGILNISVQERTDADVDADMTTLPDDIPDDIKLRFLNDRKYKPLFLHSTETGNSEPFDEKKESAGTRKLFHLAPLIFETLLEGGVLIMDELDNNMHPFMAELIIKLFSDTRINKGNAQLIFSTHNINLMSAELLRRDQIWFTEKQQGVTKFYSLDDFDKNKIKPQSPFNQWYAEGRFGAVPVINYQGIVDLFNATGDVNAQKDY